MRCEQARELFDTYLDGELSASLAAELAAHKLQCPGCRQSLALMEVAGHFVASDRDEPPVSEGFTERLLACIEAPKLGWLYRFRRAAYIAGPLAAAAVIALAFFGLFDHDSRVAGEKKVALDDPMQVAAAPALPAMTESDLAVAVEDPFEQMLADMQEDFDNKRMSEDQLQQYWGMSILQMLDFFGQALDQELDEGHFPGADVSPSRLPLEETPPEDDDIEDL